MEGCLFCSIASGAIKTEMVFTDEAVCVFRDIHPKAPVHLLIIPREHIESVAHLEEGHAGIAARLIFTAKRIASEQGLSGYQLVFNVGRDGGQVVDHLHLHLLGGWKNGEGSGH